MQTSKQQAASWRAVSAARPAWRSQTRLLLVSLCLFATDVLAVMAAIGVAYVLRAWLMPLLMPLPELVPLPNMYTYLIVPLTFVVFLQFDRLYQRRLPLWQQMQRLFKVSIYALVFILCVMYFTETVKHISRPFMAFLWFFSFFFLAVSRYAMKQLLLRVELWQVPVILIGGGRTADVLLRSLEADGGLGYKVVGVVDDRKISLEVGARGSIPVLGGFSQVEEVVLNSGVRDVLIAAPGLRRDKLVELVSKLQPLVCNVTFVPDLRGIPLGDIELDTLLNEKIALLKVRNNLAIEFNRYLKRALELCFVIGGIALVWPALLGVALAIRMDSSGPIMFAHKRIGANGKVFPCFKFRTMVPNAQQVLREYLRVHPEAQAEWEKDFKLKRDPRITRVGAFLRATSLDELPQLLNVLRGEMSLVGPRPIVRMEISRYGEYIRDYYLVRPGMTGYWQVHGRNDVTYEERVQMDSWYVRNWSLWLDIVLLLKTIKVVCGKRGAY